MESIADRYNNFSAPAEATDKEKFVIDTAAKAEWAIKKIAAAEAQKEEAETFVTAEKEKLDAFLQQINAEKDGEIEFFKSRLMPYALQQLEGSKKKSVKLPSGTLSFKSSQPKWEKDEETLKAFLADSAPEMLESKISVKWGELKKILHLTEDGRAVTPDGEIVPGVTYEAVPDKFSVTVAKKAVE